MKSQIRCDFCVTGECDCYYIDETCFLFDIISKNSNWERQGESHQSLGNSSQEQDDNN